MPITLPVVLHLPACTLNKSRMTTAALQQTFLARMDAAALAELFSHLGDVSFFLKDRRGRFMALNRRGCDYCGVANEADAIGRTDRDFFPRRRADSYMRDDETVMTTGKPLYERVESAPEGEASPRLVLTVKVPVRGHNGRIIGVAGLSRPLEKLSTQRQALSRLDRVIAHLHANLTDPLPSATLAGIAGLSISQLERSFRRAFGTSPRQHLLRLRIESVCRRLAESDDTIAAIAVDCGFADHAHLSRSFRRLMQMTPSQYRSRLTPTR